MSELPLLGGPYAVILAGARGPVGGEETGECAGGVIFGVAVSGTGFALSC